MIMTKRLLKDYADTSGKRKSTASSRHSAELFVYLLEYELIQECMCVCLCVCVGCGERVKPSRHILNQIRRMERGRAEEKPPQPDAIFLFLLDFFFDYPLEGILLQTLAHLFSLHPLCMANVIHVHDLVT